MIHFVVAMVMFAMLVFRSTTFAAVIHWNESENVGWRPKPVSVSSWLKRTDGGCVCFCRESLEHQVIKETANIQAEKAKSAVTSSKLIVQVKDPATALSTQGSSSEMGSISRFSQMAKQGQGRLGRAPGLSDGLWHSWK